MARYTSQNTIGYDARVFLDGVEVEGCVKADDELGFVVRRTAAPPTFREVLVGVVTVDMKGWADDAATRQND